LKSDYTRLEVKFKDIIEEQEKEAQEPAKLKQLEEEMTYLKRHYEMEMGLLKDENEILKRELTSLSLLPLGSNNQMNMSLTPN
jgi:hypothetical protein